LQYSIFHLPTGFGISFGNSILFIPVRYFIIYNRCGLF
jgi:hypothetical protein